MTALQMNEPQRFAVAHGEGPCLVIAGAGSGKTRVLTERIRRLVSEGVPPWRVLGFTFTNKAGYAPIKISRGDKAGYRRDQ